ncbi:MAG: RNA methyltransferase [Patescibacteria group bacterium]|jgi:tRNA G18 (ribose-2'-O)-methylase SpoU
MQKYKTPDIIKQKGDLNALRSQKRNEVYLILDNIRSMYNVGAIFRTADAARVERLYLCGITATPPRKEIEKTALKTINEVPWEHVDKTIDIVRKLKNNGVQIVALEQTDQSIDYRKFKFEKPVAIILGHETIGVDDDVLSKSDAVVDIPMYGIANSLNVSVATGIILYHLI